MWDIATVRRDLRRLRLLDRLLLATSLAFVASILLIVFILGYFDQVYLALSLYGSLSGLLRFVVWKVRAVPAPVLALAHGAPEERDAAWRLIEDHRDELLSATTLPATIHEPALTGLDRDSLVQRVQRHGTTNWRRLLRVLITAWLLGLAVVVVAVSQHTPAAEVDAQNVRGGAKPLRW